MVSLNQLYKLTISVTILFILSCDFGKDEKIYDRTVGNRSYLNHAIDAADWIISTIVQTKYGNHIWPDDSKIQNEITPGISSGVAGKVLFFLELHNSTNNVKFLEYAEVGANYLLEEVPSTQAEADSFPNPQSLYGGLSGIGFTLNEVYKSTQNGLHREGAIKSVEWLHRLIKEEDIGAAWNNNDDILSGSAGAGLFLLYASKQMDHTESLAVATRVGDALIAHSISEHNGLTWKRGPNFILPNFSHGAAGIGYFLISLYEETQEVRFLEAALKAAKYLNAIAKTDDGVFLIPYGFPDIGWGTPYDLGWAHGPAGTSRFFYRLWEITGDSEWLVRVWQGAKGIELSGMPGPSTGMDYGEEQFKMDMRFGQASVARFFLSLYTSSKKEKYKQYARSLVDDIISNGFKDSDGLHWPTERYRFMTNRGDPADFTGYFYGAAGYGLLLLHMDAVENERNLLTIFPDDPFD